MTLLQSLFVFILRRRVNESSFNFDKEIKSLLLRAEESLDVIREFNRKVPLNLIIRCSSREMTLVPKEISGGEDWFVIYRDYWKKHVETLCNEYLKNKRYREIFNSFRDFLKGIEIRPLENTQNESNPEGLPIAGAFSLSFLCTFCSVLFVPDMVPILQPIYDEGEFRQDDNRVEFVWAYNCLLNLEDEVNKFENGISTTGIYGERYAQAYNENTSSAVKKRRLHHVVDKVQRDAKYILEQARKACQSMVNILNGILGEGPQDKRIFLNNIVKISGTDNRHISDIREVVDQFQKALRHLEDIDKM